MLDDAVLITGNEVGDLAMGLFGDFVEVPFDHENLENMVTDRKTHVKEIV